MKNFKWVLERNNCIAVDWKRAMENRTWSASAIGFARQLVFFHNGPNLRTGSRARIVGRIVESFLKSGSIQCSVKRILPPVSTKKAEPESALKVHFLERINGRSACKKTGFLQTGLRKVGVLQTCEKTVA